MTLADVLHVLLLLISATAVIGVFRHVRNLRRTSDTPSERLFVLMFVLLATVLCAYLVLNSQLSKLYAVGPANEKTEKEIFVEQVYPPLFLTQKQLNSQVASLSRLQKQILALRNEHPQQKERLEFAYSVWNSERKGLVSLKTELERSIHSAWTRKDSLNNKFSREAVDWDNIIKGRLNEYEESQLRVTNTMLDNVIQQRKSLSEISVGRDAGNSPTSTLPRSDFSADTIGVLLNALEASEPKRVNSISLLSNEVKLALQKRREVRNYVLNKPHLQTTFQRVRSDWLALENRATYYRDQVLYAVQADYLARILGVNQRDNQLVRLEREISKKLPTFIEDLKNSRIKLEKSYQFAPD